MKKYRKLRKRRSFVSVFICLCISSIVCFLIGKNYGSRLAMQVGNLAFVISIIGICYCILYRIVREDDQKLVQFLEERIEEEKIPDVWIKKEKQIIRIKFDLNGGVDSQKLKKIQEDLSDLYKLPLLESDYKPGYITYSLARENYFDPLICKPDTDYSQFYDPKERSVYLDHNFSWQIDKFPHALIVGKTGGGKTLFLKYICRVLKSEKLSADLVILDPKNSPDLKRLGDELDTDVLTNKADILKKLREAEELMHQRYADLQESNCDMYNEMAMPLYCIIADEVASFTSSLDQKELKEFTKHLNAIVFKGRQAGVIAFLTLQRADTTFMGSTGGAIRDQLGLRVCLGGASADGLRMVFGSDAKKPAFKEPGEGMIQLSNMNEPRDYKAPRMLKV